MVADNEKRHVLDDGGAERKGDARARRGGGSWRDGKRRVKGSRDEYYGMRLRGEGGEAAIRKTNHLIHRTWASSSSTHALKVNLDYELWQTQNTNKRVVFQPTTNKWHLVCTPTRYECYRKNPFRCAHTNVTVIQWVHRHQSRWHCVWEGFRLLRCPFIPADLHIAYGNSPPQERIPSIAPGTSSTHTIPNYSRRAEIKVINTRSHFFHFSIYLSLLWSYTYICSNIYVRGKRKSNEKDGGLCV